MKNYIQSLQNAEIIEQSWGGILANYILKDPINIGWNIQKLTMPPTTINEDLTP